MDVQTKIFIPDDDLVWVAASITSNQGDSFTVQVIDDEYITLRKPASKDVSIRDLPPSFQSFPLQNTDLSADGVDDMCSLNYLHEPSILDNLRRRFKSQLPYTNTGDICVAVSLIIFYDFIYKRSSRRLIIFVLCR
jgi:myosin-5